MAVTHAASNGSTRRLGITLLPSAPGVHTSAAQVHTSRGQGAVGGEEDAGVQAGDHWQGAALHPRQGEVT